MERTGSLRRWRLHLAGAFLVAALATPAPSQAVEVPEWLSEAGRIATVSIDVGVLRPIGLVPLAAGAVLFVPAAWMTAFGGQDTIEEAWERFILPQGQYVFSRPIGEF